MRLISLSLKSKLAAGFGLPSQHKFRGLLMKGRDRSSSTPIGDFVLSVDRDHRGRYRGEQAMDKFYRGWHYHIENPNITQLEIMSALEIELENMNASRLEGKDVSIGTSNPEKFSVYQLDDQTTVLWLGSYQGKLHIEADKTEPYAKTILKKNDLKKLLRKWVKEGLK